MVARLGSEDWQSRRDSGAHWAQSGSTARRGWVELEGALLRMLLAPTLPRGPDYEGLQSCMQFFHVMAVSWAVNLSLLPSPSRLLALQDLSPPESCSRSPVSFPAWWWWWWGSRACGGQTGRAGGGAIGAQFSESTYKPYSPNSQSLLISLLLAFCRLTLLVEFLLSSLWSGSRCSKKFFIHAYLKSYPSLCMSFLGLL